MNGRTIWTWVIGIIVVLAIVYGIWWYASQPAASTTQATNEASTTATNEVPVSIVDRSSESAATVVAGLTDGTQYASAFGSEGGASSLSGKGPYTVFVSSDAGFGLLPAGTISNMTAAQKKRFVDYSIVSGRELDINVANSGTVQALSGDALNFHVGSTGLVQINSSYALEAYKVSNGIVYVLNQPLLPPTQTQ